MDTYEILGVISGILAASAYIPFFRSILKTQAKPHPMTWVLWTFMGLISLLTYFASGARDTVWLAVVNFIGPLFITLLSIKYWNWKARFSNFEWICFAVSSLSILIWILLKNPVLALSINLLADLIAAIPTLINTYRIPSSESNVFWGILIGANILSLLAIKNPTFGIVVLPFYLLILSSIIFLLTQRKR